MVGGEALAFVFTRKIQMKCKLQCSDTAKQEVFVKLQVCTLSRDTSAPPQHSTCANSPVSSGQKKATRPFEMLNGPFNEWTY